MNRMIRVRWDISEAVVDEEEFELIKIMSSEAGSDKSLKNCETVIQELKRQGYGGSRALKLALLARASLQGLTSTRLA
ncbi:MAG: hypothetical protein HYY86_03330 [Candidatus Harrisonbacteria bacterium]|nr:hypothetical protein [Candidatus Harrisonbacteria bacterium]